MSKRFAATAVNSEKACIFERDLLFSSKMRFSGAAEQGYTIVIWEIPVDNTAVEYEQQISGSSVEKRVVFESKADAT